MTCIGCEPEKTKDVLLDIIDGKANPYTDRLCFKHEKELWERIANEQM